jgi:hypothetical protein
VSKKARRRGSQPVGQANGSIARDVENVATASHGALVDVPEGFIVHADHHQHFDRYLFGDDGQTSVLPVHHLSHGIEDQRLAGEAPPVCP